jgi:uncharacterized membrane protein
MTVPVAKNTSRADLVRREEVAKFMLVHALREVGNVEVSVTFVGKCLELRVEGFLMVNVVSGKASDRCHGLNTHSGKADFVAKVVEATNAVLSVLVVVVLDEAKAVTISV